jgi:hypothetical protein
MFLLMTILEAGNQRGCMFTSRFRSSFLIAPLLTFILAVGCASTATYSQAQAPANHHQNKIIAVGDLHGDFEAYQAILKDAGLIDTKGKWNGGDTIFVQTGDVPDRGPDSLKIINHLRKLQKQARRKGGRVVTLVGNHEAMNMTNDLRYVHGGEYAAFKNSKSKGLRDRVYKAIKPAVETFYLQQNPDLTPAAIKSLWQKENPLGKLEHQVAWAPDGEVGKWIVQNPAISVIDGSLFVHGGLSEKYTHFSIEQMNALTAKALISQDENPESIINDDLGPLWYRGLIKGSTFVTVDGIPLTTGQEIDLVRESFEVDRIIVGHSPALKGIVSSHNNKLIQIDTGASAYYGGTRSFLRIENGNIFAHDNGVVRQLN